MSLGNYSDYYPSRQLNELMGRLCKLARNHINKDRYGRTVAELSKGPMNIQEHLVDKDFARNYERYSSQCKWSKK